MNRWAVRILGIFLLILFSLVFVQMYKTLVMMKRQQDQSAPAR